MIESREYDTLDAFLSDSACGFAILYQLKAAGSEYHDHEDETSPLLAERFSHFLEVITHLMGEPDEKAFEWDLGIPTWASSCGYALWKGRNDFISLFVSWDNPEDPAFVIIARAPLSSYDPSPESLDPWGSAWMSKGEW